MKLNDLLKTLDKHFNEEELHTLCFMLRVDYDNLTAKGKVNKARELIDHLIKRDSLLDLFKAILSERPHLANILDDTARSDIQEIQKTFRGFDATGQLIPIPFLAPHPVPLFSGRKTEITQLKEKLTQATNNTIIGLVGIAGVGKSSIAIEVAHQMRQWFPDGILWANLDVSSPETEIVNFAAIFGRAELIAQSPDLPSKAKLVHSILANKKCLIILDQAEDSEQIKWLLPNGLENVTLITTRNRKMLISLGAEILPIETLNSKEGVEMLAHIIGTERTTAESEIARRIVSKLGGIPLALSIAAGVLSESDNLSLTEYDKMLTHEQTRLDNLVDWEDKTRNVIASLELSYQSLPLVIQQMFASLAIFDGPDFSTEAVAAVMQMPLTSVKVRLNHLFVMSLLSVGLGERDPLSPVRLEGKGRYRLNSLLKLFARRKLGQETIALHQSALQYYVDLAEQNQYPNGYSNLELEWQNIVQALNWAQENQIRPALTRGILALTQWQFGHLGLLGVRGLWHEARRLLQLAIENPHEDVGFMDGVNLRLRLAILAARQSNYALAQTWLADVETRLKGCPKDVDATLPRAFVYYVRYLLAGQESARIQLRYLQQGLRALSRNTSITGQYEKGYLYTRVADTWFRMGEFKKAVVAAKKALTLLPNDPTPAKVNGLISLSLATRDLGYLNESGRYLEIALQLVQKMGDVGLLAIVRMDKGILEESQGHLAQSATNYKEALKLFQFMGNFREESGTLLNLSWLHLKLGQTKEAFACLNQALSLVETHRAAEYEALILCALAYGYIRQEQYEQANQTLKRAQQLTQHLELGYLWPAVYYLQAELLLGFGQLDGALTLVDKAITQAVQYPAEKGIAWRVKGIVLGVQGQAVAAETAFETSLRLLEGQDPYERARTQLALAQLYLYSPLKGPHRVKTLLQSAMTTFQELGTQPDLIQAQMLVQKLLAREGLSHE